jgi:hypothetical protein
MKRFVLFLLVLVGAYAYGQDSRGSITGQVTDPTGATISDAAVTVTSTDTGAVTHVTSTKEGYYTVPSLMPGGYTVKVDAQGFKAFEREGITLSTQQNVTVNVTLQVGAASEQITVTAAPPLIDIADASTGQVLTTEQVEDLPTDGGTPLGFARIEYGAVVKAKHALGGASPVSNSTVDDFSLGGGNSSSNELLLNGVPNMQDGGRTAGYSPQLDSVTEVRVDVFGANVTYGDTSGGTVNITTKSGTNQFHGSGRWSYQAQGCSELDGSTFTGRSGNSCDWMAALPYLKGTAIPPATHFNQFGGTIGGPIWIPKVFNGRNKLFFFYAYETYRGQQPPAQTVGTVPTMAERNGDFSALWNNVTNTGISNAYQLYNPYVVSGTQNSYTRAALPGNCMGPAATTYSSSDCPGNAGLTLSPIAQAYLKLVPLPNYSGATTKADGENNYFTYTPTVQDYRSHMGRIDYNISSRDKIFGTAQRSRYLVTASNYFHNALTGTATDQIMAGGQVEEIHTFSSTLFSDVRGSVTRYDNSNAVSSTGISPTSVGFPGYVAQNSTSLALPQITFTDASNPLTYSNVPGSFENFDTIQLFATVTKIFRAHTLIGGIDLRAYKGSYLTPSDADGTFSFTNATDNPVALNSTASPATFGSAFALFMLGIPKGGQENITPAFQYNSFLNAFFVQDDWKVKPNITVSVGVRFEHEIPVNESQNRMVNGFNPTATNEVTAAAEANYAAHPSSLLAASAFLPTGGATYASASNRYPYHVAPVYFSPRLGITWSPGITHGKGVVRLGFGIYDNPFGDYNQGQTYGYAATTAFVQTSTNGYTNGTLADPFPTATNPIQQPTGNALGVNTNLGAKMVYYSPVIKVPYSERTSIDVQYQIGNTILIDLGYINNHQVHLAYSNTVDAVPLVPYLSRSPYYDQAETNLLTGATFKNGGPPTTNITNPFKGLTGITGTLSSSSVIAPNVFLQTYPEFSSSNVTEQLIPGSSSGYNALNARVAKLMGHGLTVNGVFEWSRLLGTFNQLNPGDVLNYGETTSDYPFHLAGYGTYQIPVGRGRQFWSNDNRIIDGVVGGWQVSLIYQFLSGMPISWGNVIYTGTGYRDFKNVQHSSANVTGGHVFNTSVFDTRTVTNSAYPVNNDPTNVSATSPYNPDIQPTSNNYRTFPQYLLRQDYTSNWDGNVQKDITTWENVKLELRLDAFNLLNRPQYGTPTVSPTSLTFGETSGVYSGTFARQFQVGAHIVF